MLLDRLGCLFMVKYNLLAYQIAMILINIEQTMVIFISTAISIESKIIFFYSIFRESINSFN
jgi:hypothetical protein